MAGRGVIVSAALALGMVAGCTGSSAAPAGPTETKTTTAPTPTHGLLVSLGDSYAAGLGAPPYESRPQACFRSTDGSYGSIVAAQLAMRAHVVACSAATTADVLDTPQLGEPPQLSQLTPTTDVVLLLVGGNDAGFYPAATTCVLGLHCQRRLRSQVADRIRTLGPTLQQLYRAVLRRAPKARVLVLGYPRLFPERPSRVCSGFGLDEQRWAVQVGATLDAAISAAVRRTAHERLTYVDTTSTFQGAEACAPGGARYVHEIGVDDPIAALHPTPAGHRALAAAVLSVLGA